MPWRSAVDEFPGGVSLLLEVRPGAAQSKFPVDYDPSRGRIGVDVQAQAVDGRANLEVLQVVADWFHVRAADVTLVAGASDAGKKVVVRGADWSRAVERLEDVL